ncbi:hypothetical protein Bca52824_052397 [Brassica carinata]|uniref:Uncharacterized protein n=1 Tax=Brassica carinata TaxID=52824 RepID=A0A8X7UJM4_BRACI|nr:hypothetical protein Bca52824_052397 [Brassica carinata]
MMKIRTEKQLLQRNQLQKKARIEARMNLNDDKVERFDVPPGHAILGEVDILFGDKEFEAVVQNLISSSPVKNSRRLIQKIIHCFWSAQIELLVG